MPITPHSLGPLTIGSTTIAVKSHAFTPGILAQVEDHSGLPYPYAEVIPGANPTVQFTAYAADIYALVGADFFLETTTFDLYLSKYDGSIRTTANEHTKLALSASCRAAITLDSLSVSQDGTVMAECTAVLLANTSTDHPVTVTNNNALPALSAAPILHSLGPLVVNAVGIPGDRAFALDLGHTLETSRDDGDLYPRRAALVRGEPKLTIQHANPVAVLGSLGLLGSAPGTVIQYGRRVGSDGTLGASNGLSLTLALAYLRPLELTSEQGRISTTAIEATGRSTSTTHPVVVSTSATVPAAG